MRYRYFYNRPKRYKCPYCGKLFGDFNKFRDHLVSVHDVVFVPLRQEDLLELQQFILRCGLKQDCEISPTISYALRIGKLILKQKGAAQNG